MRLTIVWQIVIFTTAALLVVLCLQLVLAGVDADGNSGRLTLLFGAVAALAAVLQLLRGNPWKTEYSPQSVGTAALRRTRPRPFKRYALLLVNTAVGVSAFLLLILSFFPESNALLVSAGVSSASAAHFLVAPVVAHLLASYAIFFRKNQLKHRKLLRVERTVTLISSLVPPPTARRGFLSVAEAQGRIAAVNQALENLLATTERDAHIAKYLNTGKPPKTAWILLPDHDSGNFRTIHLFPQEGGYHKVARQHFPRIWDEAAFAKLKDEWSAGRSTLRSPYLERFDTASRGKLRACGSLTGYVYGQDGPRAYRDISQCEVYDDSYAQLLAADRRDEFRFRSAAGIPLQVGSNRIGVLMLYDVVRRGFLEADATSLRIWAHILAVLVAENHSRGIYENMDSVF